MLPVDVPIDYAVDAANVAQAGKIFRVEQISGLSKGEVYIRLHTTLPRCFFCPNMFFFMSNELVLEQQQRFRCGFFRNRLVGSSCNQAGVCVRFVMWVRLVLAPMEQPYRLDELRQRSPCGETFCACRRAYRCLRMPPCPHASFEDPASVEQIICVLVGFLLIEGSSMRVIGNDSFPPDAPQHSLFRLFKLESNCSSRDPDAKPFACYVTLS